MYREDNTSSTILVVFFISLVEDKLLDEFEFRRTSRF